MEEIDTDEALGSSADSGLFTSSCVDEGAGFLAAKALTVGYDEEDLNSDVLVPSFDSLDDQEVHSPRERMRGQKSQADMAQASQKVIEMLSELIAQLVIPAVVHHLHTRDPKLTAKETSVPCEAIKYVSCDENVIASVGSPTSKHKAMLSDMVLEDVPHIQSPRSPGSPKMEEVKDLEKFIELAPQKTIRAIVNNLDKKEGTKTDSHAWKILRFLFIKMKCTEEKTEEGKVRSVSPPYSCFDRRFENKLRDAFTKGHVKPEEKKPETTDLLPYDSSGISYPLTVSSEQVINEVSSKEFRSTSLKALTEFLQTSVAQFSVCFGAPSSSPSVDVTAVDLLDTVTSSVTQLSLPRPRLFTWPWQKKKCSTVSEDAVTDTALVLKTSLQEKLRNFFGGHKLTVAELEDKMKETGKHIEGTKEHIIGFISHDKVELLHAGNIKSDASAPIKLEKLISQEQLVLFSNMVTNRVTYMFQERVQHMHNLQNPNSQTEEHGYPWTTFRQELHSFIVDSVKCLLASIAFPPSFWKIDQLIQDQTTATKSPMKGKTLDDVVSVCSELVADQVIEHLSRSSVRQETAGQDK